MKNRKKDGPIFIISSPRSGSTLLKSIINSHSRIAFSPASFMFNFVYPFVYTYGDLNNENNLKLLIEDFLEFHKVKPWPIKVTVEQVMSYLQERSFFGVYTAFHKIYADHYGKERWGEKTTRNIHWIGEILSGYPDAQFIHIIRDGRDVAIDWMNNLDWPKNLYCTALNWRDFVNAIKPWRKKLGPHQLLEIHYEDLVQNPPEVIQRICGFLEEEYEPKMLEYYSSAETLKILEGGSHHRFLKMPITTEFMGMYKEQFEKEDREMLAKVIGKELKELGYSVEDKSREIGVEEMKRYVEDARTAELRLMKYQIWHKERREKRKQDGIWSDAGMTKAFG